MGKGLPLSKPRLWVARFARLAVWAVWLGWVMTGWAAGVEVPADFGEEIHTGEEATARVLSVREAGPVEQGTGHGVTGTFQTWNADVRELWMEGLEAPVRVTGGHLFYSASRGWVEAHRLAVGETVRTRDGSGARVLGLERLPGVHAVFNLEVEGLHQYHVSPLGLLAHNNNGKGPSCGPTNSSQGTDAANKQKGGAKPNADGKAGEEVSNSLYGPKNTESISVNGRERIPDHLLATDVQTKKLSMIEETKNVQYQHMSKQLRDDLDIVGPEGKVILTMPAGSKASKTIRDEPRIEVRQDLPAKRKRK